MADEKAPENIERGEKILKEKVDDYKAAHPEALPEVDYAFLMKTLKRVNENSPMKIARNAFNEKREWIPGTETWYVGKVFLNDDHCVVFTLSHSDKAITVSQILDELEEINNRLPLKDVPIMVQLAADVLVRITDLYAHSLVSDQWAGFPVDFVLCYTQKQVKKQVAAAQEQVAQVQAAQEQ